MPGPGFLELPVRSGKPRRTGITHVLDRGLPLSQATDLLEQIGCYIDVWKFGWGIAYLDPQLRAQAAPAGPAPGTRLAGRHAAGDRLGPGPDIGVPRLGRRRRVPLRRGLGR